MKKDLQARAAYIRQRHLNKPIGKSNVAIAEIYLSNGVAFCAGATSKRKGPIPDPPLTRSQGGQFEPSIDSRTGRSMNTDAEYKVLSEIAKVLEMFYDLERKGSLYLYSELQPCESCNEVLRQFEAKFPNISVKVFWDLPYPKISQTNKL